MPLYDALIESPIKHILCRHEQGAAFAANGQARATGRIGVCIATSGPGATNLLTGLADAYMDSVPLIALTGQVPTGLIGTDAFQEIDILGMSLPVTKASFQVQHIEQLPGIMEQALHLASAGCPGPVLIDLPKDIQLATLPASQCTPEPPASPAIQIPNKEAMVQALAMLEQSRCPILYVGGGVVMADAIDEFRAFVDSGQIPSVFTLKGLGALPAGHPLNMGMLGMHGSKAANQAVQEADLLIAIGARFDDRVTGRLNQFAPKARVIHLDIDPAEIGKLRQPCCALPGEIAPSLVLLARPLAIDDWRLECRRLQASSGYPVATSQGITAPQFLRELSAATGRETYISCDVGQHQMWVAQHYPIDHPRHHLTSGGLGAMGFGLPAAIGAQSAHPDALVINIAGDGSFMMNLQELATIKRYQLPIKIIIFDNQALGMVRQQQAVCYESRFTEIDLSDNPDFVSVATSFGIPATQVTAADEVSAAIEQLLNTQGPALLHVPISTEQNVWPMVRPGDANEQMMTGEQP